LLNVQLLSAVVQFVLPDTPFIFDITFRDVLACALPVGVVAALSLLVVQRPWWQRFGDPDVLPGHQLSLAAVAFAAVIASTWRWRIDLTLFDILLALITFAALIAHELIAACRANDVRRVWSTEAVAALAVGFFALFGVITFGRGFSLYAMLATGAALWAVGRWAAGHARLGVLVGPFTLTATVLPLITVVFGVGRHLLGHDTIWMGMNSLALLLAAGWYFWRGMESERRRVLSLLLSALILNVALALLWSELEWSDPQCFMIPLGISVIGLVELLKSEIPQRAVTPLRYAGALLILVSPTFHIAAGSWLHLVTLMLASVLITLLGMGLRVRALAYTGTAFLAADMAAMVVRGSVD
ncbi:MAG: hypothetical protein ACREIV_15435, partial [Planctomycetaceae bacterium]